MVVWRIFPSSLRRGGRDLNKISRSLLYGADGVVVKFHRILWRLNTTPSAHAKDASRLFLGRAASPPRRGGENSPHHHSGQQPLTAGGYKYADRPAFALAFCNTKRLHASSRLSLNLKFAGEPFGFLRTARSRFPVVYYSIFFRIQLAK